MSGDDTETRPTNDHYISTLETIDTLLHTLLEDLTTDDDLDDDLREDAIDHLRTARSEIDPVLLTFRQLEDDQSASDPEPTTDGGHTPIILQWTPEHGPRRKIRIELTAEGWTRTETVWNGREWCGAGTELVTNPTIHAPAHANTTPTPPTLQDLLGSIADTWETDEPYVLVFDGDDPTVIIPTEPLRIYNERTATGHITTIDALYGYVRKHGLPTPRPLAETPYSREQLTGGDGDE